jgi:hypothetical protein
MTATPAPQALFDLFPGADGKEYTLTWSSGSGKDKKGWVRMTDLLFNYYFWPAAFGSDGAYETRSYAESVEYAPVREIGKPAGRPRKNSPYTLRVKPTYRSSAMDTGDICYAVDGKKLWKFEVGGRITEFRIWLDTVGRNGNLRRPIEFRTITGEGSASVPSILPTP